MVKDSEGREQASGHYSNIMSKNKGKRPQDEVDVQRNAVDMFSG